MHDSLKYPVLRGELFLTKRSLSWAVIAGSFVLCLGIGSAVGGPVMSIQGVPLDLGTITTAPAMVPVEAKKFAKSVAAVATPSTTSEIPPALPLLVPATVGEEATQPTVPQESIPEPTFVELNPEDVARTGQIGVILPDDVPPVVPLAYEAAERRPDFVYRPGRLEFQMQATYQNNQSGLAVGPGVRPGTTRFVPVGNF